MPTSKPRVTIVIDAEMRKAIEDYRQTNNLKSQSQAILALIKIGLDDYEREKNKREQDQIWTTSETVPKDEALTRFKTLVQQCSELQEQFEKIVKFMLLTKASKKQEAFAVDSWPGNSCSKPDFTS